MKRTGLPNTRSRNATLPSGMCTKGIDRVKVLSEGKRTRRLDVHMKVKQQYIRWEYTEGYRNSKKVGRALKR